MSQIIAVINDKGGVAKTTTASNLGTALWLLGYKVLLVDTDQQCNLTQVMDRNSTKPDEDGKCHTLFEWLMDAKDSPINERYNGLDFIPSSRLMANAQRELVGVSGHEMLLKRRLKLVSDMYDYIIIDSIPGGKNVINTNILVAADQVIIPVEADVFSLTGTPNLRSFISEVCENYEKKIQVLGYLLVKYDAHTRLGKQVKAFFQSDSPTLCGKLLPVQIRTCQKAKESQGYEQTLFEYAPESTAADDYMMLAERLSGCKARRKTWTPQVWGKKANEAFNNFKNL